MAESVCTETFFILQSAERVIHGPHTKEVKSAHSLMPSQLAHDWWILAVHRICAGVDLLQQTSIDNHRTEGQFSYLSVFVCEKHSSRQMLVDV